LCAQAGEKPRTNKGNVTAAISGPLDKSREIAASAAAKQCVHLHDNPEVTSHCVCSVLRTSSAQFGQKLELLKKAASVSAFNAPVLSLRNTIIISQETVKFLEILNCGI